MPQIKVDTVLYINNSVLIVYYTPEHCWQFRILSSTGGIFGETKIYYTSEAARRTGRFVDEGMRGDECVDALRLVADIACNGKMITVLHDHYYFVPEIA